MLIVVKEVQMALTALNPASFQSSCSRLISSSASVFSMFMDGSALLVDAILEGGKRSSCSTKVSLSSMSTGMPGSAFSLIRESDVDMA